MTALVLIDLTVNDLTAMERYEGPTAALMEQFGGKLLAKELKPQVYEGTWSPTWLVVLEFPSRAAVAQFYAAENYQPLKALRNAAATSNGLLVIGD